MEVEREYLKTLFEKRIIVLNPQKIDWEISDRLRMQILVLNAQSEEPIRLIIDCTGGDIASGLALYDAVRLSPAPIIGIVNGVCDSMALVILQACKQRIATKFSTFLHHQCTFEFCLPFDESEKESSEWERRIGKARTRDEEILKIFTERTSKSAEELRQLEKRNEKISAEEALEWGLIDKIW